MHVHIGQTGHQKAAGAINNPGALRYADPAGRPDGGDPISLHQHRLVRENGFGGHWNQVHMHERGHRPDPFLDSGSRQRQKNQNQLFSQLADKDMT